MGFYQANSSRQPVIVKFKSYSFKEKIYNRRKYTVPILDKASFQIVEQTSRAVYLRYGKVCFSRC